MCLYLNSSSKRFLNLPDYLHIINFLLFLIYSNMEYCTGYTMKIDVILDPYSFRYEDNISECYILILSNNLANQNIKNTIVVDNIPLMLDRYIYYITRIQRNTTVYEQNIV
jgi:hypothetical protein